MPILNAKLETCDLQFFICTIIIFRKLTELELN